MNTMLKLLVAVDGSERSCRVLQQVATRMSWLRGTAEVHLLNVQPPVPYGGHVTSVVGQDAVKHHHQEEGMAALKPCMDQLTAAGIPFSHHIAVGEAAPVIVQFAKERGFDQIAMGTRGQSATANLLLGSVAQKVLQLTDLPVLLIK